MKLPNEFLTKMRLLLGGDEYDEFISSYDMPRYYGIRVNTLKISVDKFMDLSPFSLERIPWAKDGFYYQKNESPGKHPFYYAGLYYIQEPSAMLPATVLDAKPGEHILDLCAAPGGKTVQIAAGMKGEGILVANDVSQERLKALVKNIELCGVKNAIVTNEQPKKLSENFQGFFDKILVDAPCSGEGMFRKDENAAKSWGKYKCDSCSVIQKDILEYADIMLKPGGKLVYSTCTFSPEEDEVVIGTFLKKHSNYIVSEIPLIGGIENGRPEWFTDFDNDNNVCIKTENEYIKKALKGTVRLWPHKVKGEGHFVALLEKVKCEDKNQRDYFYFNQKFIKEGSNQISKEEYNIFKEFIENNLNIENIIQNKTDLIEQKNLILIGSNLYYLPVSLPKLNGIKVVKFGWYLGSFSKGRFEPSHSMVIALKNSEISKTVNFSSNSREIVKYLKGETIIMDGQKGYTAICVDGFTIGWAKQTGNMLKNLYPKGWRKTRE